MTRRESGHRGEKDMRRQGESEERRKKSKLEDRNDGCDSFGVGRALGAAANKRDFLDTG